MLKCLHVYYDNFSEWVIAENKEEAKRILMKAYGIGKDEVGEHWIEEDDNKEHTIRIEDTSELEGLSDDEANDMMDSNPNIGWKSVTRTNKEWIEHFGKGCLCSSEY